MKFKGTKYRLLNVGSGRVFDDEGWTLTDPEGGAPSLLRAVYEEKNFTVRDDLKGLYRYAGWLPVGRTLRHSHAPVTYRSRGLAEFLGMDNLYLTLSGYVPRKGTCRNNPAGGIRWKRLRASLPGRPAARARGAVRSW